MRRFKILVVSLYCFSMMTVNASVSVSKEFNKDESVVLEGMNPKEVRLTIGLLRPYMEYPYDEGFIWEYSKSNDERERVYFANNKVVKVERESIEELMKKKKNQEGS